MTLRDVSLVDKDVTVAIVKIEHVDSEKMVFLTIKRLKTWGKFFDNRLNKAADSSKGRFLTSQRAFDLLSDSPSCLEIFFLRRNDAFWDQIRGTPNRTKKWTRINFHFLEHPLMNFILPLSTISTYGMNLEEIGHQT